MNLIVKKNGGQADICSFFLLIGLFIARGQVLVNKDPDFVSRVYH